MNISSNIFGLCCAFGIICGLASAISSHAPAWHYLPYVMTGISIGGLFGAGASFFIPFVQSIKNPSRENKAYLYGFVVGIALGVYGFFAEVYSGIDSISSFFASVIGCSVAGSFLGGIYGLSCVWATKAYRFIKEILFNS